MTIGGAVGGKACGTNARTFSPLVEVISYRPVSRVGMVRSIVKVLILTMEPRNEFFTNGSLSQDVFTSSREESVKLLTHQWVIE